ncbi:MAG TPA: M23 family metallopeptidase, partial [Candidatus Dormibacteraeota bacterium]|nr:M23 family metallopeptidase [Candidatus Dormibacteraeota bacterium]
QVLANPVAAQRPDLLHFSVTGSSPASWLLGGIFAAGTPSGPPPLSPQAALVLLLVAGGGMLIAFVLRGRRRKLIAALLVVPAALAIAVPAGAAVLSSHQTAQKTVASTHHENQRTHTLAAWATSAVPTWTQLIGIENALSQQHDAIVNNETEIAHLTVAWQTEYMHITPHTIHPMVFTVLAAQLRQLVQEHAALSTAYETSLQNEYTFFLNAAKNPVQLGALQTAATHTPANVQQAVQYDVTVVETQLSQEAAINAAAQQIVATQAVPTTTPFALSAPVSGVVSQAFGPTSFSLEPPLTYNGFFYPHFHTGLDIAAPLNTLVGAAGPGQVILAGSSRDANGHLVGYGNYVVIRHANGILTLYGHLNRLLVTTGQIVGQGQVIGLLGSTGWSTGPHVHFEVRVNGMFVDPARYIASQIR